MRPELESADIQRLTDYMTSAAFALRGRFIWRLPAIVANDWAEHGYCVLPTNTLARRFGTQRKSMWRAIATLRDHGFITEIGRTEDGKTKWAPVLERGDEWRQAFEAREAAANDR